MNDKNKTSKSQETKNGEKVKTDTQAKKVEGTATQKEQASTTTKGTSKSAKKGAIIAVGTALAVVAVAVPVAIILSNNGGETTCQITYTDNMAGEGGKITVHKGDFVSSLIAEKEGYTLIGWKDTDGKDVAMNAVITSDMTLVAIFAQNITISLNVGGTSIDAFSLSSYVGQMFGEVEEQIKTEANLHILAGYEYDTAYIDNAYQTPYTADTTFSADCTVYVKCKAQGIALTVDLSGIEGQENVTFSAYYDNTFAQISADLQQSIQSAIPTGKVIESWQYYDTETEQWTNLAEDYVFTSAVSLKPCLTTAKMTISYWLDGQEQEDVSVDYGTTLADFVTTNSLEKDGYVLHWYSDGSCTSEITTLSFTENATIYGKYIKKETVSYTIGDATGSVWVENGQTLADAINKIEGVTISLEGFDLAWYTDADFSSKIETTATITSATSIYAKYYMTINYVASETSNGSVILVKGTTTFEDFVSAVGTGANLSGYSIDWYTDTNLTSATTDADIVNGATLYAKYVKKITLSYLNASEETKKVIISVAKDTAENEFSVFKTTAEKVANNLSTYCVSFINSDEDDVDADDITDGSEITAKYFKTINIQYENASGEEISGSVTIAKDTAENELSAFKTSANALAAKTGYELSWCTTSGRDVEITTEDITNGATLYANYSLKATLSYYNQTEDASTVEINIDNSTTFDAFTEAFKKLNDSTEKTGFTFEGWYTDDSYTTKWQSTNKITEQSKFYAKYVSANYIAFLTATATDGSAYKTITTTDEEIQLSTDVVELPTASITSGEDTLYFQGWIDITNKVSALTNSTFSGSYLSSIDATCDPTTDTIILPYDTISFEAGKVYQAVYAETDYLKVVVGDVDDDTVAEVQYLTLSNSFTFIEGTTQIVSASKINSYHTSEKYSDGFVLYKKLYMPVLYKGLLVTQYINSSSGNSSYLFKDACNIEEIIIPDCVTLIGKGFAKMTNSNNIAALKSVKWSKNANIVYDYAFYSQTALESFVCDGSLRAINEYAFYGCTNLQTVDVNGTVRGFGAWSFGYCTSLEEFTFSYTLVSDRGTGKSDQDCQRIFKNVFSGCTNLKTITFNSDTFSTFINPGNNSNYEVYSLANNSTTDVSYILEYADVVYIEAGKNIYNGVEYPTGGSFVYYNSTSTTKRKFTQTTSDKDGYYKYIYTENSTDGTTE